MLQMAVNSDHAPKGVGPGRVGQLCQELELAGAESLLTLDSDGAPSTGVTLTVDATDVASSRAAADVFRQQVFAVLARGLPVSVSLVTAGAGSCGHAGLRAVCNQLYRARCAAGVSASQVGIVVDGCAIAPGVAADLRRQTIGDGPVHVVAGAFTGQQAEAVSREELWAQLSRASVRAKLSAALAPLVTPPCALLSAEPAYCVQPLTALQIPAGSAWLPVRLELARFTDATGAIALPALEHALRRCVRIGDALHDLVAWPTAQLRHDAWLNRRLAIELRGFGDLAVTSGLDPQHFKDLQELCDLLRWMRATLHEESRAIANEDGFLPAFRECDPSLKFPRGQLRNGWRTRWLEAVQTQGLRHRNLITLSPWCVLPRDGAAAYRYADLLPLLSFADAVAFPPPPDLAHWQRGEFIAFHRRAWAVLQQRSAGCQIAEGP